MYSGEGEEVQLSVSVQPTGNIEDWLCDVEKSMKLSLRDNIERSLKVYPEVSLLVTDIIRYSDLSTFFDLNKGQPTPTRI